MHVCTVHCTFQTGCREESNVSGLQRILMSTFWAPGLRLRLPCQGRVVHLEHKVYSQKVHYMPIAAVS